MLQDYQVSLSTRKLFHLRAATCELNTTKVSHSRNVAHIHNFHPWKSITVCLCAGDCISIAGLFLQIKGSSVCQITSAPHRSVCFLQEVKKKVPTLLLSDRPVITATSKVLPSFPGWLLLNYLHKHLLVNNTCC